MIARAHRRQSLCSMSLLHRAEKKGRVFQNPVPTRQMVKPMPAMMWEWLTNPRKVGTPSTPLGPFRTDASVYAVPPASGLRVTWMGHSSTLLELDGLRILIDPVWGQRASPVSFAGPKRFFPAPIALSELPPLHLVLLSHDHFDHLDEATIRVLAKSSVPFVCPLEVGKILQRWGVPAARITEMDWTDEHHIGNLKITATPARHFTGRSLRHRNETLWCSYVLRTPAHNVFYGGDSGAHPLFAAIGNAHGPFDLTMLEVGAYGDGWPEIHSGPEDAVMAHQALRGKVMMPIHWGLFNLAFHPWKEPVERVRKAAGQDGVKLFLPEPGRPTEVGEEGLVSRWWE